MSRYSVLDRLTLKAAAKAAEMVMAPANRREVFDQFVMTATAVTELSEHMRRVTFHAPEFATFAPTGPDEYFGLLMANGRELIMPPDDRVNVRASLRAMPEEDRPDLRWYTVRAHRQDRAEIDVDFVIHGDAGPGTRWARRAIRGDKAGFRAGGSAYRPPAEGAVLLVADETALPALTAILEAETRPVRVFAEVPDESYRLDLDVEWVFRGSAVPGSAALKAVQEAAPEVDYAWVCGESALATGVRRHLVKDRGVDRRSILFSGYWKLGTARL